MARTKKFEQLNESKSNGYTPYDLWVVQKYVASEIDKIYLNKEDAEKARDEYAKEYYDHYRKVNKQMSDEEFAEYFKVAMDNIKVISLDDAIDNKVESAVDQATIYNEDY